MMQRKKEVRAGYLATRYQMHPGADYEEKTGKGMVFEPREERVKRGAAEWKGVGSLEEYHAR